MSDIPGLLALNRQRWEAAQFKPASLALARKVAARLVAPQAKAVYVKLQGLTGVPWYAIAMIHEREASQRWDRSIAQGDPWNAKSIHVPEGRGPFNSFIDAAVDALVKCPPYAARWKDWTPGGMLTLQELYNGLGYANGPWDTSVKPAKKYPPQPSAYIWSGTDQYKSGKYIRDRVFKPDVVDSQLGCAVMLKAMMEIDASIYPQTEGVAPVRDESADHGDNIDPNDFPEATATPSATNITPPPVVIAEFDAALQTAQVRLKAMNYTPGGEDGKWGGMTAGAFAGFINDRHANIIAPTSTATFEAVRETLFAELSKAESDNFKRPVAEGRANADATVVAKVAPEVVPVKQNFLVTAWGAVAAFFAAIWNSLSEHVSAAWAFFTDHKDSLPTDSGMLKTVWGYISSVPSSFWIVLGGIGLALFAVNMRRAVNKINESVQTGARQ